MIGLANSTGWEEDFILWSLPLSRGLQYQHTIICMSGAKTIPSDERIQAELADMVAEVERMEKTWQPLS